jgi:hypothetical protein
MKMKSRMVAHYSVCMSTIIYPAVYTAWPGPSLGVTLGAHAACPQPSGLPRPVLGRGI